MEFRRIGLAVADEVKQQLYTYFTKFKNHVERGFTLRSDERDAFYDLLSQVLAAQPSLVALGDSLNAGGDTFFHVSLCHTDPVLLNMPWETAPLPGRSSRLVDEKRVSLSRAFSGSTDGAMRAIGGPLKILIMTSLPEDLSHEERLHVEEEEKAIVESFDRLFRAGEVQIDYTFDGSLEALQQSIERNNYHILHFSGHGQFDRDRHTGYLLLEDAKTYERRPVSGREFAQALIKDGHTIPLVFPSACQSGESDGAAWSGVAEAVLRQGIPAVVAMSMSVSDRYAALFAAHFYLQLANKKPQAQAFQLAKQFVRQRQAEDMAKSGQAGVPMQWLIPVLYSKSADEPLDWSKPFEPLKPEGSNLVFANVVLQKSETDTVFIGRRRDFRAVMPLLYEHQPVLLTGAGGVGKSTLAKKVIRRLQAFNPKLIAFMFNDEGKDFSLVNMQTELEGFCFSHAMRDLLSLTYYQEKATIEKIALLMTEISGRYSCIYVFDNVETFQGDRPGRFLYDHQPILKLIEHAMTLPNTLLLLTGRYPVVELESRLSAHSLNDVSQNDFILKCYYLGMELTFAQAQFLYTVLGGNFRAVEFFFQAFQSTAKKGRAFAQLEAFADASKAATEHALQQMAENLFFTELWNSLSPLGRETAAMLALYDLPVLNIACLVHNPAADDQVLLDLKNRTLLQAFYDGETELVYYFMPPLVRTLAKDNGLLSEADAAFHQRAGQYHEYMYRSVQKGRVAEQDAAYMHFVQAGNREKINEHGEDLAAFYYARALYRDSLRISDAADNALRPATPFWCANRLGMIFLSMGNNDAALPYFEQEIAAFAGTKNPTKEDKENYGATLNNIGGIYWARGDYDRALAYLEPSLQISRELGDKRGEGTTLNNISGIYWARGDYDRALAYLEQSLQISRELGDKSGEGTTLNNIGQIFKARGDYDRALAYLEQSLQISRELGDKSGMIPTLHNMAHIHLQKQDMQNAFQFFDQAYRLAAETQDAMGLFNVGRDFGSLLVKVGERARGEQLLRRSLAVGRAAGIRGTEQLAAMLEALGVTD